MQYLCLGKRDKNYIKILGVSKDNEVDSVYKRNINIFSLNLNEPEFFEIKLISEKDILNEELVVIQANSFAEARNLMIENGYKNVPHSSSAKIKKEEKFSNIFKEEKKSMLPQKKH